MADLRIDSQARVSLGWRGRRAAVGTLIGLFGIFVVLLQYAARGVDVTACHRS